MDPILAYVRSFSVSLRAENKAPRTVSTYVLAVEQFALFLTEHDLPVELGAIEREHVAEHLAWLVDNRAAATAAQRYASLRQFFKWAVEEGELDASPMDGLRKPKVPDKPVPVIPEAERRALLDACQGRGFEELRDTALLRLFIDTGSRLAEIANLKVGDIDLERQQFITVTKGQHLNVRYFGNRTTQALDRYDRARRRHRYRDLDWFWLAQKGRLSASGISQVAKRRSKMAGIPHINVHRFRHTFAHEWLAEGGNESNLVNLMGWKDRQMLQRYGSSAAQDRAADAHRRMALGDRF